MRVDDPAGDVTGADSCDIADIDVFQGKISGVEVDGARRQPLSRLEEPRGLQGLALSVDETPRAPAHLAVWRRRASGPTGERNVHAVRLQYLAPRRPCQLQRQRVGAAR